MERSIKCIKASGLPSPDTRKYVKIYAKRARKMFSSSTSPLSKRTERASRSNTPTHSTSPSEELPLQELSDVPCYTCRRRHVKCDRILPSCAKCAKRGIPCLGYTKPLRWADGVAVRGKLKGKAQPVVDSNVVSIVRNTMQIPTNSAMKEAAHFGLHTADNFYNEIVGDDASFLELMTYHNTRICQERVTFEQTKFINREIAPLSFETAQKLPKDIVNCILGNAAVHMASRNPGNLALERLALETKVKVFQNFNQRLQNPQDQLPDVILIEHGMNRWMVHFLGSLNVVGSFGGIENLCTYYPHLQLTLTHMAFFETMWIILSHIPATKTKAASRKVIDMLCHASQVKQRFYNPCPAPLTLAIWEIGACAQRILGSSGSITFADMHKRDEILRDILAFVPEDGTKEVRNSYYKDIPVTEARLRAWDLISTAWRGAITILTIRYLYFGRPQLVYSSQMHHSPTPSLGAETSGYFAPQYTQMPQDIGQFSEESTNTDIFQEHLSTGLYPTEPLSRSPSPLPSPLPITEPPSPELWNKRYKIHDQAFYELSSNLFALHDILSPVCLRYILLPLLILALVSRPGSAERTLCISYFALFKEFMTKNYPRDGTTSGSEPSSPVGGEELGLDLPWQKLDACSEMIERQTINTIPGETPLKYGAPEWNWWDMLKAIDLRLVWPITSGTSHFERGHEFWAFKLMSSVVNDECFSAWLQASAQAQTTSSST